ncbi:MAG TPA: hypothetical protein VD886_15120, partial [Herpetosiphonaceae bacterium]|nr:hypothetical protein [Herpetosiphonaceae bacterium]
MQRTVVRSLILVVIVAGMLGARPGATRANGLNLDDLPAACAGVVPSEPNRWLAVWNFDSSAQGCMIYTGLQPDPSRPPLIESYALIECAAVGKVEFTGGQAFFDGQSYLSCPFTPAPAAAPDSYGAYQDFWIYASVGLNPGYRLNPIFHHPSASMDVRTLPTSAAPAATMARLEWRLDQTGDSPLYGMAPNFIPGAKDRLKVLAACSAEDEICADPKSSA